MEQEVKDLFKLGEEWISEGAEIALTNHVKASCPHATRTAISVLIWATFLILCHVLGDWGLVDQDDRHHNEEFLERGEGPLVSEFELRDGKRILVYTEPDRANTSLLLPDEFKDYRPDV